MRQQGYPGIGKFTGWSCGAVYAGLRRSAGCIGGKNGTELNSYDNSFGCEEFLRIIDWMPYIIELDFEGDKLVGKHEHCYVEKEFKGNQRADKK